MTTPITTPEPPPLVGLDLYDAHLPVASVAPPPPLPPPLATALQRRLDELATPAADLSRHWVREAQRLVPQHLAAARQAVAQQLAPVLARRRQIDPADHSRGAEAARWLLDSEADTIRARVLPALEPAVTAATQLLDAVDARCAAILVADRDVPPLDGSSLIALNALLQVWPHLDPDERVTQVEALIGQVLREPLVPPTRAFLRHLLPLLKTARREPAFAQIGRAHV